MDAYIAELLRLARTDPANQTSDILIRISDGLQLIADLATSGDITITNAVGVHQIYSAYVFGEMCTSLLFDVFLQQAFMYIGEVINELFNWDPELLQEESARF